MSAIPDSGGSKESVVIRIFTEDTPGLQGLQLAGLFRTLIVKRDATSQKIVHLFVTNLARGLRSEDQRVVLENECVALYIVAEDGSTAKELGPSELPWVALQDHPTGKLFCSSSATRASQRSLPKPKKGKKRPFTKSCAGPIFEMPLTVVMEDQGCGYIPWIVEKSVGFLFERMGTPGLFRQNGSEQDIQEIVEAFDRGEDVILSEMTDDPHVVAGLLLLYLDSLPEPLLTFERYRQFIDLMSFEAGERIKHARALVDALPEHNYAILEVLCTFLAAVALRREENLMDSKSLAAAFGPVVLYRVEERGQSVLKEIRSIIDSFEFLILNREQIFGIQTLEGDISSVYVIDRELGVGAFAVVKVVRHQVTGVEYAAKFIDKSQLATEDKKMLEREVQILRRLRHPHIISLKAVCETPKHLILITELARGGELFDRIAAQGAHAEQDVIKICRQLISAIGYLHSVGIAHRDLKPENILLRDKEGLCVKLADFGLGRIVDEGVAMSTMCGTPSYVAPEVLLGKKYTMAVDMWSVGVITYILLSGRMPFFGKRMQDLCERIVSGTYAFPEERWAGVSSSAKEFIRTLLQVDPEIRATAKQAYMHPFLRSHSASSAQLRLDAIEKRERKRTTSDLVPVSITVSSSTVTPSSGPPSSTVSASTVPSSSSSASSSSSSSASSSSSGPTGSTLSPLSFSAPASTLAPLKPHNFTSRSFRKPSWCDECTEFIGVFRNGHQCKQCKVKLHKDCIPVYSAKVGCGDEPAKSPRSRSGDKGSRSMSKSPRRNKKEKK